MASYFDDTVAFEDAIRKTMKRDRGKLSLNPAFIERMMMDELAELRDAQDEAEQVDALLDMVYYLLHSIARIGLDANPIWKLIHEANMSKFTLPGGYEREDGKWMKPPEFVSPDDAIRNEIAKQRKVNKEE